MAILDFIFWIRKLISISGELNFVQLAPFVYVSPTGRYTKQLLLQNLGRMVNVTRLRTGTHGRIASP
ncbi:hypothetical protein BZZ01_02965 [Nostocales cyanobacterium HT-58-2]|nr:hypothetical protein BZZ01_02965 [Nostocales cyanobacterium HT-58-2]